ncbi:MAG TPA: NUDIX hydrolase, partial [Phenylobacterium sp.]|nr:NUDIX hydrolase [Phenylobacterium sp.]
MTRRPEGPPRIPGARAVRPKNAATVMIIRRDAAKPRVLMGKRHAGHSFMPDRWVFPGGRI